MLTKENVQFTIELQDGGVRVTGRVGRDSVVESEFFSFEGCKDRVFNILLTRVESALARPRS